MNFFNTVKLALTATPQWRTLPHNGHVHSPYKISWLFLPWEAATPCLRPAATKSSSLGSLLTLNNGQQPHNLKHFSDFTSYLSPLSHRCMSSNDNNNNMWIKDYSTTLQFITMAGVLNHIKDYSYKSACSFHLSLLSILLLHMF